MGKTIIALAAVNLALAGILGVTLYQHVPHTRPLSGSAESTVASASPGPAIKPASFRERAVQPKTPWASIAATDLHRYADNLRRVGCPEQTIREILLAEVNRLYGPRERALKVRPDDIAPWETAAVYDRRSGETKLRQLLEEKRALLKDLTGVDTGIDMPSRLAGRDVEKFQNAFTTLPDAKREQVRAIQENYWAQSDEIKQKTIGYLEPEDRDEFLRIKTERRDALAKVLDPRELQDFELATSETAPNLRNRFNGFEIKDDEFRKIFDYYQPLDEKFSLSRRNPDPVDSGFTTARADAEKSVLEYIHTVLGDDRFAEYQRSRDPIYQNISQAGAAAGLPKDAILQAYQAQQQVQEQSQRIMQDSSLTPEQRGQSLNELRAAAQQRLQQTFGDKAAQILQQAPMPVSMAQRYGISVNPVIRVTPNGP